MWQTWTLKQTVWCWVLTHLLMFRRKFAEFCGNTFRSRILLVGPYFRKNTNFDWRSIVDILSNEFATIRMSFSVYFSSFITLMMMIHSVHSFTAKKCYETESTQLTVRGDKCKCFCRCDISAWSCDRLKKLSALPIKLYEWSKSLISPASITSTLAVLKTVCS